MTTEVWVVTEGAYSDFGISAIFSTKEKADAYCEEQWKCSDKDSWGAVHEPEKWTLDAQSDKVARRVWRVCIDTQGRMTSARDDIQMAQKGMRGWPCPYANPDHYFAGYSTVSQDHAMKVAAEARQAFLRKDTT